jgi:hypothetical protein
MTERSPKGARGELRPVPCPTGRNARWYPLLLVQNTTARRSCILLSDQIYGFRLHFCVDGASGRFTLHSRRECELCRLGWPAPWYGFAAVLDGLGGALRLLSLPQAAYQWCDELRAAQGHLRGRVLTLQRPRGNRTGPLVAHLGHLVAEAEQLPRAFDVVEQVGLRFGEVPARVRQALAGGQS